MNIEDNKLITTLQIITNKKIEDITFEDLQKIEILPLSSDEDHNYQLTFEVLQLFPNLKRLTISDAYISKNGFKIIASFPNIESIAFYRCMFDKEGVIFSQNIKNIEIIDSFIEKYDFLKDIKNLESLVIFKAYLNDPINLEYVSNISSLRELNLDKSRYDNFSSLIKLKELKSLSLLDTTIPDNYVDIINQLKNLEELWIPEEYNSSQINSSIYVRNDKYDFLFDEEEETVEK